MVVALVSTVVLSAYFWIVARVQRGDSVCSEPEQGTPPFEPP